MISDIPVFMVFAHCSGCTSWQNKNPLPQDIGVCCQKRQNHSLQLKAATTWTAGVISLADSCNKLFFLCVEKLLVGGTIHTGILHES